MNLSCLRQISARGLGKVEFFRGGCLRFFAGGLRIWVPNGMGLDAKMMLTWGQKGTQNNHNWVKRVTICKNHGPDKFTMVFVDNMWYLVRVAINLFYSLSPCPRPVSSKKNMTIYMNPLVRLRRGWRHFCLKKWCLFHLSLIHSNFFSRRTFSTSFFFRNY